MSDARRPVGVTVETALLAGQARGVVGFDDHTIDIQAKDSGTCLQSVVQFADVPGEAVRVSTQNTTSITTPADIVTRCSM